MNYEEFEKSVVVDPKTDLLSSELIGMELRFQIVAKFSYKWAKGVGMSEEDFIEFGKRELYEELFVKRVPYTLPLDFGMTEDEFEDWCRRMAYEEGRPFGGRRCKERANSGSSAFVRTCQ